MNIPLSKNLGVSFLPEEIQISVEARSSCGLVEQIENQFRRKASHSSEREDMLRCYITVTRFLYIRVMLRESPVRLTTRWCLTRA